MKRSVSVLFLALALFTQLLAQPAPGPTNDAPSTTSTRGAQQNANCTDNGSYVNSKGQIVKRPETCSSAPQGATAQCRDGTRGKMVRPERFELPTFWFVAVAARRISNMHGMGSGSTEWHSVAHSAASAAHRTHQYKSIRVGTGHKIGHSDWLAGKRILSLGPTHPPPLP